jgi:hypothetical protein
MGIEMEEITLGDGWRGNAVMGNWGTAVWGVLVKSLLFVQFSLSDQV